jgi:murein L,D-transpeptidase YafK
LDAVMRRNGTVRVVVWRSVLAIALTSGLVATAALAEFNGSVVPGRQTLEIWKSQRKMELRYGDYVDRTFAVMLGRAPRFAKEERGDYRTPVGRYYIAYKKPSRFGRFLGISYPNIDDAERGYQRGLISADQWADIFFANLTYNPPTAGTPLGGMVGIHGFGSRDYMPIDWTEGCIAVSNDEIEYLYEITPVGTPVIIHE